MSNSPAKSLQNSGDEFTKALNMAKIPIKSMDAQMNEQDARPGLPSRTANIVEDEVRNITAQVVQSWNATVNALTNVRILRRHHDQLCDNLAESQKRYLREEISRALELGKIQNEKR
jgi:hypothetical protein